MPGEDCEAGARHHVWSRESLPGLSTPWKDRSVQSGVPLPPTEDGYIGGIMRHGRLAPRAEAAASGE